MCEQPSVAVVRDDYCGGRKGLAGPLHGEPGTGPAHLFDLSRQILVVQGRLGQSCLRPILMRFSKIGISHISG